MLMLPQTQIEVNVDYYDSTHEQMLMKYPSATRIQTIVRDGASVSTTEFLTYYMFHRKRPGKPGWSNYNEIGKHINTALAYLDQWIEFNGTSISTPPNVGAQEKDISEHIGESLGLAIVNEIHGLTAADWDRVPEQRGKNASKTFDYQIASDNKSIIQLEAKGSSAADNSKITSAVSNHKNNIVDKKQKITSAQLGNSYRFPADLRYGVITVVGTSKTESVKCLLVDPPAEGGSRTARELRLLQRLRFIRDWVAFISPRSQLAASISTRLEALRNLADPFELDGVPLLRGSDEPYDFAEDLQGRLASQAPFFATKSTVVGERSGGVLLPLRDGALLFAGIRGELLDPLVKQDFDALSTARHTRERSEKIIECLLPEKRFQSIGFPSTILEGAKKSGGYYSFRLPSIIQYSDSGILFGLVTTNQGVSAASTHTE